MNKCFKVIWYLFAMCLLWSGTAFSQIPFNRGVNLSSWFQVNSPGQIQFTRFTKKDLANIKSLGCDVIRLPIAMHSMTSGSPGYTLDPLYFLFLDSVVKWAEDLKLYLILDNHSYDPEGYTSPDIGNILIPVWTQMAQHYKNRSDYVIYEIFNEPHDITASTWGTIQGQVINAIRAVDTKHTIIVGGVNYNTYTELQNIPVYTDLNLIYTFHFYDPFMFTHQGATWVTPSMAPLSGVPFPYNASEMPSCPEVLKGTWIENSLNSYPTQGTVGYVKSLIDIAVTFKNARDANVYCGEIGVYNLNSDPDDRRFWYSVVSQYLKDKGIPWTSWDYQGGFGLFRAGSNQLFDHDLDTLLLDSLRLNVPSQTPFVMRPDSVGFMIYTDYIGQYINEVSYGTGAINFYSSTLPNNNKYCTDWTDFSRYNTIGFDFAPDKDLSRLKNEGYALDFIIRGNNAGIKFDVRFIDTKTGTTDHPWRMGYTIDEAFAAWDRKWHHVHIPLSSFNERGSWDNGSWYNAEGKFDWTKIDRFEFSTEYAVTSGQEIWIDNLHMTNQDTALVRESGILGIRDVSQAGNIDLSIHPNPFDIHTTVSCHLDFAARVSLSIFTVTGNKLCTLADEVMLPGHYTFIWDGSTDNGLPLPRGIYLCVLQTAGRTVVRKIIR